MLIAVYFAMAPVAPAEDTTSFKTYPLLNSDTNAITELVRAVAGEKAQIFFYQPNNELIISATSNQHTQIAALLKEINLPSPNVRIEVVFTGAGTSTDAGLGASGKATSKITKKGSSYQVQINPYARNQSTTTMDNNSQSVIVKSGKEARIFMGQEVPFYQWLVDFGLKWNYINTIEQKFEMKQVGSAMIVEPRVLGHGPMISVTLIPEISGLVDGKPHKIQYTRVATEVTVRDGETIDVGSFGKNSEFYNKFLTGFDKSGSRQSMQIRLTANIQK